MTQTTTNHSSGKKWWMNPGWTFVALLVLGLASYGLLGGPVTVERLSLTLSFLFFLVTLFIAGFQVYLATRTDSVIAELKEISRNTQARVEEFSRAALAQAYKEAAAKTDDPKNPDIDEVFANMDLPSVTSRSSGGAVSPDKTVSASQSMSGDFRDLAESKGWLIERAAMAPDFLTVVRKGSNRIFCRSTRQGRRSIATFESTLSSLYEDAERCKEDLGIAGVTALLVGASLSGDQLALAEKFENEKGLKVVPRGEFGTFLDAA